MSTKISTKNDLEAVDPLEIQSSIVQIFQQYQQDNFYQKLLQFVVSLTNARASFLLEHNQKKVQVLEQVIAEENYKYWSVILQAIEKKIKAHFRDKKVLIGTTSIQGRKWSFITTPIASEKKHLCLVIEISNEDELAPFILILQMIAAYIPFMHIGGNARRKEIVAERVSVAIELINQALRKGDLFYSAQNIAEKLKKHLECQRVSIGMKKALSCKLLATSDGERFDKRSHLVKSLEGAMQESIREQQTILYPLPKDNLKTLQIDVAHKELQLQTNGDHIITVPLRNHKEKAIGAWVFIWEDNAPQPEDMNLIDTITPHISEVLFVLKNNRPNIFVRTLKKVYQLAQSLRNWLLIAVIVMICFAVQIPWTHYVKANCQIVPVERYTITAPFNGILKSVLSKPGDMIKKGQILATLDDRELKIEYIATEQSLLSIEKQMTLLFAQEKMADYNIAKAEKQKIKQKIKLLRYRLGHLEIKSPNNGVLLQGDLLRSVGSPLEIGQMLFEIAPVNDLIIETYVDETDISYLKKDMQAELRVDSYPDKTWESKISYIAPISEAKDSRNIFICEMPLTNQENQLLPGMNGTVRIISGEKPIWWLWLHRPISWIKMKMWW